MHNQPIGRRRFLAGAMAVTGLTAAIGMTGGLMTFFPGRADAAQPLTSRTRLLLGTVVTITAWHADLPAAEDAIESAFAEISRLQRIFDRHDAATPLSLLNQQGSIAEAPAELLLVTAEALRIGARSGHAFDMTVRPIVDYLRAHKNPEGEMRIDPKEFAEARALVRPDGVRLNGSGIRLETPGMGVTLDAIAKGYIADKASEALRAKGVTSHLVNAGGDIRAQNGKGENPWMIGIEDPRGGGRPIAALPLRDKGIATSGGYEMFYDRGRKHHHLIDPATGESPAVLSVSVIAPTVMEADALATALSILPVEEALRFIQTLPGRECLIVEASGALRASPGWG